MESVVLIVMILLGQVISAEEPCFGPNSTSKLLESGHCSCPSPAVTACLKNCCYNKRLGINICCLNTERIHPEPVSCDNNGECLCAPEYYGPVCDIEDVCYRRYSIARGDENCGLHGKCDRELSKYHVNLSDDRLVLSLVCTCDRGWSNYTHTGPDIYNATSPNYNGDGLRDQCHLENPCESSNLTCNQVECGNNCQCHVDSDRFHGLHEKPSESYPDSRRSYYRRKHNCTCGDDFYLDVDVADPFRTQTCYKKKCVYGPGVQGCSESKGGVPVYKPCLLGYSGATCSDADFCIIKDYTSKCRESGDPNAKCVAPARQEVDLHCDCSYGYSGKTCNKVNHCLLRYASNPAAAYCGRYGKCDGEKSNANEQICKCDPGRVGKQCIVNGCISGSATCIHSRNITCNPDLVRDNEFNCGISTDANPNCKLGWFGAKCNVEDRCITQTACNSAKEKCRGCCHSNKSMTIQDAINPSFAYYPVTCNCGNLYYGRYCEHPNKCNIAQSRLLPVGSCSNNGKCIFSATSEAVCKCDRQYHGQYCEHEDFCVATMSADPCDTMANKRNRCVREKSLGLNDIFCDCAPNFDFDATSLGKRCVKNPCFGATCLNGGTPSRLSDNECRCICPPGLHGPSCEFEDKCSTNPCKEFQCTPYRNSFNCSCDQTLYSPTCDVTNLCLHNPYICDLVDPVGQSQSPINHCYIPISGKMGEYFCTCDPGWLADLFLPEPNCFQKNLCEHPSTKCDSDGTAKCSFKPGDSKPTCVCKTKEFYFGPTCAVRDVCEQLLIPEPYCSKPGTKGCIPIPNATTDVIAICSCHPGFYGERCEYIDKCSVNPCQNDGLCTPVLNDYVCNCQPLYRSGLDENCNFQDGCYRDNPCKNDFNCVPYRNLSTPNDWICECDTEYQRKADCSERDPCVTGNPCQNGGKCDRVNDTTSECLCNAAPGFMGEFCEIENSQILLDAYPLTAQVGEERLFILIVEKRGSFPKFKIGFGDSFNFEISEKNLLPLNLQTIQEQRGILHEDGIEALTPFANDNYEFYPFTHMYNSKGTFTVETTVYNSGLLSEKKTNLVITNTPYCLPDVRLQNCGKSRSAREDPIVPQYERKSRFVIESSLYYRVCDPPSTPMLFKWNLFRLTDVAPYPRIDNEWEITGITEHENGDKKHIIFLPYNLLQGEYWIQLFVYYELEDESGKKPVGNLDWCYFNLKNSPPIVRIEGGSYRTIHLHDTGNEPLVLNASTSIDQNDPGDPKLTFEWNYRIENDSNVYPCSEVSTSSCTASWIEVDVRNLDITKRYTFHVDVTNIRANEVVTTATALQEVSFVDEGLEVIVQCIEHCLRFTLYDIVHIECGCRDCGDGSTVMYSHIENSKFRVTKIGNRTFQVALRGGLSHNEQPPEFVCVGRMNGIHPRVGKSALLINMNTSPLPGTCSVTQTSRARFLEEIPNNIFIICQGYTDPEPSALPLTYSVTAAVSGFRDSTYIPEGILLVHDVYERLPIAYLPMGKSSTNYELFLLVRISDAYGSSVYPNLQRIEVFSPGTASPNSPVNIAELHERLDFNFGFHNDTSSQLTRLLNAGDNQKALQLILSAVCTFRPYEDDSKLDSMIDNITNLEREILFNRIVTAIRRIPFHSYLIVKQVMQSLYLLSYQAESFTDETLLSFAEQLIRTTKYFRNYIIRNDEVIYLGDIRAIPRAGQFAAEKIMLETERRGRKLLKKDADGVKKKQEVELQHLYQKDRDYFLEVDELMSGNENVRTDQPEFTTLNPNEVENVKKMASICQRSFLSILHLLEAIASVRVLSTTSEIELDTKPNVKSSVDIYPIQDLIYKTQSGITFPQEIVTLIEKQNTQAVQLHYRISEIDPYFGDFGIATNTKIFRVELKVDGNTMDGTEQWIRISDTIEPILIRIPVKHSTNNNSLHDTIVQESANAKTSELITVELVPFDEISDLNPNIKMTHLNLIHGSSFYMIVTTRSTPASNYSSIEYQAALTLDYRPTADDFCRQDTNYTRRFGSGEVIEFKVEAESSFQTHAESGDYLDYYIGIWPFDESGEHAYGTQLDFSVNFVQLSCLSRDEDENKWIGKGCEVSGFVDGDYLECKCHHLSIFAGSVVVPPNKADFAEFVDLLLTIPDNYIVLITVASVLGIWLIGHLICYWKDRDDRLHHTGITIMCEIGENFSHTFYLVRVVTGSRISAGTTANVSLQIYGENGRSKVYVIKDSTLSVLNRGGNDSFLISSTKHLGHLEKIRVWHDNTGSRPGWYLRKIIIREIKTGKRWYFFADIWLSMTYERDPNIIREFPVATQAELNTWKRRFSDRLVEEFNNSHLWFSLFFRLPSSNFTRCQRWGCSVAILVCHMLFNIMWEGIPTADYSTLFEVGDFSVNLRQFLLGLQIAIFSSPVGIILILLFRRIRRHRIPTLVLWQDRVKRHNDLPNIREENIFVPDAAGEFKETVIPVSTGGSGDTLGPRVFAVPSTDMFALESWVSRDTRGHGLRPPTQREPDAFVHKVEDKETEANHSSASHMLRIGRRAIAETVRRTNPDAFIYSGDVDFEAQFDAEIRSRAEESHPWTKLKKTDIQAIEVETKAALPKIRPVQVVKKEDRNEDLIYHGISLDLCLMAPVYKKRGYFPWWFIYISWTLAVFTIVICAFFTIFFGLSIGRLRSWHWLTEISFSFIQTVVITQPVRILVMASIFSVIDRKIHASEEDRFQVVVDDGTEQLSTERKLTMAAFQPTRSYPPCSGPTLLKLRLKARRRNELKRGMVAFFFHILAMIFLASIISNSSSAKFAVTSHVKNMLQLNAGGTFEKIKTAAEFYKYMNYFAQIVNPVKDYNGIPVAPVRDARYESTMMADNETMILGIPRIRQVRTKRSECPIHERIKSFYRSPTATLSTADQKIQDKINCTRGYTSYNEDLKTYNPFWKEVIGNSRSWKSTNDVWIWRTPNYTQSIINSGKLAKYDAGGYVAELGMQYRKTISVLNYLRQTKWIDSRTRAVFVEMSVIVPNGNIFADILLLLELSPAGAYVTTARVLPLHITFPPSTGQNWRTWVTICYVGISLYAIGLILSLGRGIAYHWIHYRMGFVGSLWLWLDFGIGVSAMLAMSLAFKFHFSIRRIQERLDTSLVNEFINLQRIAFWDHMHISFFAAIFGLCIIKTWRFLILFLNRFYILALTLRLTARLLLGFMFIIVILVVAFACWGVLAFGDALESFNSISTAFLELKHQLLLATFYDDLRKVHAVIGRLYFLLFGLSLVLVGVNLFVALLASGFLEAKEIARQRRHRETYWTAFKKSRPVRFIFGEPRPKNAEQKLPIPPMRVKEMEHCTIHFIQSCLESKGFTRMKEMLTFCNTNLLKGTGYKMMSKKDKKQKLRNSMNTSLTVSKTRLEDMRLETIAHIRQRLHFDLTPEDVKGYADFHLKLLEIKVNKTRKVLAKLDQTVDKFLTILEREEAEALETKLKAETEKLKQSAMGWRRYLPPELLLNISASQHKNDGNDDAKEIPGTNFPNQPKSPAPTLRRRTFF